MNLHYKNSLSVVANHSKSDFFYRKLSSRKRGNSSSVLHRISLKQRSERLNSTAIDLFLLKIVWWEKHRITHHYSAVLQKTAQTLRTAKYSIESTYSDFPCSLKADNLRWFIVDWSVLKGKTSTITASLLTKISLTWQIHLLCFPAVTVGAFHSTKYSRLKFRVFHATNGKVFSGSLD